MRRALELLLILATAIGGYLAWKSGQERSRLQQTFDRLVKTADDLKITDPTWVHIRAIPTGEPLHFAWHIYVPANYPSRFDVRSGGSGAWGGGTRTRPDEFIARVRFREYDNGFLNVYAKSAGGSTRTSVGDQAFATLLRGRWNDVVTERVGADGLVAVKPDRPITLLKLRLPGDLEDRAKATLPPHQQNLVPVFLEVHLGPQTEKPYP